jgi:L-fucose isomerase-like protein
MNHLDCGLTRRHFGAGLLGLPFLRMSALEAAEFEGMAWNEPARIAKLYLAAPVVHWPRPDLNVDQEMKDIEVNMAEVAKKHAHNVRFTSSTLVRTADDIRAWKAKLGDEDGVIIIPLSTGGNLSLATEGVDKPVLVFSRPYASHLWSSVAAMRKTGRKIDGLATTSYGDLDPYMRIFKTVHHLRTSRVLVAVENAPQRQGLVDAYHQQFGTTFEFIGGKELRAAFDGADAKEAQKAADEFTKNALRVIEPSPKEIFSGVRFYIGLKALLKERKANAVSIDCFGTLAAKTLPGYPCIAWSKLNDVGLYGVCEADMHSTMTQMLVTSYAGVPGFVSDPVFDTSRNEVIHAHCVAATKLKGPDGPASPYTVRSHLETAEGAVLQVTMPVGETVTVAKFADPKKFLYTTGEVTGSEASDRGCRSQVRTRVSDAEKWLENYSAGLHRVLFYGDHTRTLERMGRLMGFSVINEIEQAKA